MALTAIVTNAGRAALVNAANTGTAPVTIAQVGLTATAVVPGVGISALPGEYMRIATISGDVVADDTIHLIVRDESADVFTVRSFALYLADGTLFAIYGQAGVVLEKSAQAMMLLAIDIQFADVAAAMLTFGDANFLNPPATTERQGVVELATVAEAQAGIDALRALTPAAAKAAILGWLLGQDGSGSGLDADLLDGQDGSYYSNIPGRLGYTPVNKAGDTMSGALATPALEVTTGDVYLSRTTLAWGYIIRPNVAGYKNLQFAVNGGGALDNLELNSLSVTIRGFGAWHSGNDGAGSGLDADLLDGQDGSYYSNIIGRLGYTPVNRAGDTVTGVLTVTTGGGYAQLQPNGDIVATRSGGGAGCLYLNNAYTRYLYNDGNAYHLNGQQLNIAGSLAWNAGNDGSGSGLDADLLDGQHGSYYADIIGRLGFTPIQQGTGVGQSWNTIKIGWSGSRVKVTVDTSDMGNIVTDGWLASGTLGISGTSVYRGGMQVWGPDNDGSGSGLDADLLDGFQAAAFGRQDGSTIYGGPLMVASENQALFKASTGSNPTAIHRVDGGTYWFLLSDPSTGMNTTWNALRPLQINLNTGGLTSQNGQSFSGGTAVYGSLYLNGYGVWSAGNDGAGSGLDADLLDGYQADAFNRITQSNLTANGGRRVHSDGYIEHWGVDTTRRAGENSFYFAFPTPFPNECFGVEFTTINTAQSNSGDSHLQEISLTKDGFTVYIQSDTNGQNDFWGFRWKAHGR